MKTVTATTKGVAVNYENTQKSTFIPYGDQPSASNYRQMRYHYQMNNIQYGMYQQLMLGPKAYGHQEFESMPENVKFAIRNKHMRATEVLNKMKYEKAYGYINKLFAVIFPDIKLDYYKDGKYADMPTLRELGIKTVDIIDAWIDNKLLPLNFYDLNEEKLAL